MAVGTSRCTTLGVRMPKTRNDETKPHKVQPKNTGQTEKLCGYADMINTRCSANGAQSRVVEVNGTHICLDHVEQVLADAQCPGWVVGNDDLIAVFHPPQCEPQMIVQAVTGALHVPRARLSVQALIAPPRTRQGKIDYTALSSMVFSPGR